MSTLGLDAVADLRDALAGGSLLAAQQALVRVEQYTCPVDEDGELITVYLCDHCGQPLRGPDSWCNSGIHVGPNSGTVGRAVPSTQLVQRLRNALAPASALQQHGPPG
jgi:hypothetical protein